MDCDRRKIKVSVDCEVYGYHKLFAEKEDVFGFLEELYDETVREIIIKKSRHAESVPDRKSIR